MINRETIKALVRKGFDTDKLYGIYKIEQLYGFPITDNIARGILTYRYDDELRDYNIPIWYGDLVDVANYGDGIYTDEQKSRRQEMEEKMK